jgi:cardiolipin synthase
MEEEWIPSSWIGGPAVESVELLDGGAQAFPRMLGAIGDARATIHLEVYNFARDRVGQQFISALSEASKRNVSVRVVIDGWGSARSGRSVSSLLTAAGCDVEIFHPLRSLIRGRWYRNHRKLLVIDDEVTFLGGINIADDFTTTDTSPGWADLAVEIRGAAVRRLGQRLRREPLSPASGPVQIYLSGLGGGWRLRRRYLKAVRRARQTLAISHGYFIPDVRLVRAIVRAARRGVQVSLLLAGKSDVPFARTASMRLYRQLLAAGVRIFEWTATVLHVKAATVDGKKLLVGSFNLDPLSLVDLETLVEVNDGAITHEADRWIQRHARASREITMDQLSKSRFHRWIIEPVGSVIARFTSLVARALRYTSRG